MNGEEELTCKPLDSYAEIVAFLKDPPAWRVLCKGLAPHSQYKIHNMDINKQTDVYLDEPQTFCHFEPEQEDPARTEQTKLPKTLVCHDMANGYHDDSFIDGTAERNAYTFYNWAGIDIFCYFSHHLITIPPVGWINIGHAHGVKVLGTVITEWGEGVEFWDEILGSESAFQNFAKSLVNIAKILKFDGWLLNVENKISKPDLLIEFVQHLHFLLHEEIPHAELIWYDSVTIKGHLNWQNALNENNRPFFDACDGLFTNYSWTVNDIESSAKEAGERIADLYIGIDVWGRNFYGGGQFNTQQAVKVAYEHGCSLAVFAPAWTHEALSMVDGEPGSVAAAGALDRAQRALLRDRALWGSLWPFLNTRLPTRLPFYTSFCRGLGMKRRLYGEVISRSPWYNLRHQQYQPNSGHGPHGYLLCEFEAVRAFSQRALPAAGIIRYRRSFEETRLAQHAPDLAQDKVDASEPPPEASRDLSDSQKPAKRNIKSCIKEFFGAKTPRTEATTDQTVEDARNLAPSESREEDEVEERTVEEEQHMAAGASLVSVSVNLRLGRGGRARAALVAVPEQRECLEHYLEDSFTGGSCLRVHPSDRPCPRPRLVRLFHCDFWVERSLVACVVTKCTPEHPQQSLHVRLHVAGGGAPARVVLLAGSAPAPFGDLHVAPLDPTSARFHELQKYLLVHETGFFVPVENFFGWRVRYYWVELAGRRVTSVCAQPAQPYGAILLGHFGVCCGPASAHIDSSLQAVDLERARDTNINQPYFTSSS